MRAELGKPAVAASDARTFEVIEIEIRQQMQTRNETYDLDRAEAIVGDKGFLTGRD